MEFKIPEENMERLGKKLAAIRKKCEKYGCEFSYKVVGEEVKEEKDAVSGLRQHHRYVVVDVEGTAKISGWELLGEIEYTPNGNIVKGFFDAEIPVEYHNARCVCEHCGTNRVRKYTYIVRNEAGECKQVGKSCLADYTHGLSAEFAAFCASIYNVCESETASSGSFEPVFELKEVMPFAYEIIRRFGYVKSSEMNGTISKFWLYLNADHGRGGRDLSKVREEMARIGFDAQNPESVEKANAVIKWARSLDDDSNNYLHNLRIIFAGDWIKAKHVALAISAFAAYDKALERKAAHERREADKAREKETSEWQGNIGDRITIADGDVKVLTSYETMYGTTYIYKIVSKNNVFIWKTSKEIQGEKVKLTGTVKAHSEYNGVRQTELTRCRVMQY